MAFSSVPSKIGPFVVRNVLCTIGAGALLRVEDVEGRRRTVMLLDPDLPWPSRLGDRRSPPEHPRLCGLSYTQPSKISCGDRTFYYMNAEALSGWTVLDEVDREGPIQPLSRAIRFCAEAAEALACAHEAGLPHGHLEPGCLFIQTFAEEHEGHIKLLGAGLRVTAGPASRAARYRPSRLRVPRGTKALVLADQIALGGILYHMVTGQPPVFGDVVPSAGHTYPERFGAVLRRALSDDPRPGPEQRFASVAELRDALLGLEIREPGRTPLARPLRFRNRVPQA